MSNIERFGIICNIEQYLEIVLPSYIGAQAAKLETSTPTKSQQLSQDSNPLLQEC